MHVIPIAGCDPTSLCRFCLVFVLVVCFSCFCFVVFGLLSCLFSCWDSFWTAYWSTTGTFVALDNLTALHVNYNSPVCPRLNVCNDLAEAMKALDGKKADWYPLLLGKLAESVVVISGAPNVGKSSLAVHLARTLGLTRTKTTSKNFWLFARSQRPYFSLWVYCTDSFSTVCIIYYFKRRIRHRSSHSRGSPNFCFSRLCRFGHHCCLPGGYGQTFV